MKRALITGATGFIGSHLARRLVHRGYEVHAICRQASNLWRLEDVRDRLHVHRVRLEDRSGVRRVVRSAIPDLILHLAAATMHGGTSADPLQQIRTNFVGTCNLIDACEQIEYASFVNTGDAFEYGPRRQPHRELNRCRPTSIDGASKLAATLYAQHAALTGGKPIVTLRLFSVFGPYDDPRRLIPQVVSSALAGAALRLSRPSVARDFVYVDDVVDLFLAASNAGSRLSGSVFNAGSGRPTTIGQIVETVLALTRSCSQPQWGLFPAATHDRYPWLADATRARKVLGWQPRIPVEAGLATTVRWAKKVGRRQRREK